MKFLGLNITLAGKANPVADVDPANGLSEEDQLAVDAMNGELRAAMSMQTNMARAALTGSCPVAGIPGKRRKLSSFQKFRTDWTTKPVVDQIGVCRAQAELNWFANMVHTTRLLLYMHGFSFTTDEARSYAGLDSDMDVENFEPGNPKSYPWAEVVGDIFYDYLAVDNVVAMWRKDQDGIPHITVMDAEDVEVTIRGGFKSITITYQPDSAMASNATSKEKWIERLGKPMYEKMCHGGQLTIDDDDPHWAFDMLCAGKRKAGYATPAMVSILDDLDFIEMMKIGDWNGAYTRKDILRIATKGGGVSSGGNAGLPMNSPDQDELDDISGSLKKINGLSNMALSWDTAMSHVFLDSEFFGEHRTRDAIKRLIAWGGLEAALLMDGFSQVSGVSPYMARLWRPGVIQKRKDVAEFAARIFNHPSFRSDVDEVILYPQFNEGALFNTEELIRLVDHRMSHALMSNQSGREMHGLDNEKEGKRIKDSHGDPLSNTPVHEPRQGIVKEMRNMDDNADPGGGSEPAPGSSEEGGRPKQI